MYETLADAGFLCDGAPVTAPAFGGTIIGAQYVHKAQASVCLRHYAHKADQRYMGAPVGFNNFTPFQDSIFKFFWPWRASDAQIVNNMQRNSFACVLAPYFPLFQ